MASEEDAPLLNLEQEPNTRPSMESNVRVRDDDESSKELPPPVTGELPPPVTALGYVSGPPRGGFATHIALLVPRVCLSLCWFALYLSFGGMSIVYMSCWCVMQLFTGFTRVEWDKKMVRRDLGGFFDTLMDLFERIW